MHQIIEITINDNACRSIGSELQQQAFSQIPCANALGFELLQEFRQTTHLFGSGVNIFIESQFVAEGGVIFREKSALIERTNEIDHNRLFVFRDRQFTNLTIKFIIRRVFVANLSFAAVVFSSIGVSISQRVGHIVERAIISQLIFHTRSLTLTVVHPIISLSIQKIIPFCTICFAHLQGFIVEKFVLQARFKICQRHLYNGREQNLRTRRVLHLLLLLSMLQSLALWHGEVST